MIVSNLLSPRGNKVPSQFRIENIDGFVYFQSYESKICTLHKNYLNINFYNDFDYSRTTGKYLNIFLSEFGLRMTPKLRKYIRAQLDNIEEHKREMESVFIHHDEWAKLGGEVL